MELRRDSGLLRALPDQYVPEQPVEDTAQRTVDRLIVQTALQMLSVEQRQALFECYLRGASIAEAADTLNLPPGTVKSRIHYALHALRQAIDGDGRRRVTKPARPNST